MNKRFSVFLLSVFLIISLTSFSTSKDSVNQNVYKINILVESGDSCMSLSLDSALNYYRKAFDIAKKYKLKSHIAKTSQYIGKVYERKGVYDEALEYYQDALRFYKEIADNDGIAENVGNMGNISYYKSNYTEALSLYHKALMMFEENGNKKGVARNLGNIGNVFYYRNDLDKALSYYKKALEVQREINNIGAIANSLINIGNIYSSQGRYDEALKYYQEAISNYKNAGKSIGIALAYGNTGVVYDNKKDYEKACEYYRKALDINQSIGNSRGTGYNLIELAEAYFKLKNTDKALLYARKSLTVAKRIGDLNIQKEAYSCLSDIYQVKKLYKHAIDYKDSVLQLNDTIYNAEKTKAIAELEVRYETEKKEKQILEQKIKLSVAQMEMEREKAEKEKQLSQRNLFITGYGFLAVFVLLILFMYRQKQKANNQLKYQKEELIYTNDLLSQSNEELAVSLETVSRQNRKIKESEERLRTLSDSAKDVIILVDNDEKISMWNNAAEETFGYTKEEVISKNIHDLITPVRYRDDAHKAFALFKDTGRGNALNKTIEIEGVRKNGEVFPIELSLSAIKSGDKWSALGIIRDISERKNHEKYLIESKKRIEILYKDLIDNINYAKVLQQTLLTSDSKIRKHLKDYFIIYMPRDQVSGDFYYVNKYGKYLIFAVADSTGHGVSGGFLTVLGITYLHDIISAKNYSPEKILNLFRKKIKRTFRDKTNDGYDIALCVIDTETDVLEYAGAFNPLWIIRNETLMEVKATRNPIGPYLKEVQFEKKKIQLEENDLLYMFTDGFPDQFGGADNKKFKLKNFRELIVNVSNLPMNEQKDLLEKTFNSWKADNEQTDDVTILGLKYKLHRGTTLVV
ncbi:MAG: tetratricopeptide repeat protein [Chlorobi bacterium]|nr:tetratricopeptide repeat protein [Chlorobiota bacterium]